MKGSRCIFCKRDSSGSRSIEHILPESLGNEDHILPPGFVCDSCNNYFASSVEQHVLESERFRIGRLNALIPNKRKRLPSITGILLPGQAGHFSTVEVSRELDGSMAVYATTEQAASAIASGIANRMIVPTVGASPTTLLFSRFLGKVAVEAMAAKLVENDPNLIDEFIDDAQVDQLRNYARYGTMGAAWPFSERTIYAPGFVFPADTENDAHEVLHEWIFMSTEHHEMYFVLAILGMEYAINMGGPEIEGYELWLKANPGKSPLYP
jgi:hypothetical protein